LKLPKFELYEEGGHIRGSSKSVTAAIVNGYGRRGYKADFVRFLIYAQSERDETILHLEFLFETKSFEDIQEYNQLKQDYEALGKRVNIFTQWVENNLNDFTKSETGNR
jgi:four helix bundle protein